MRYLQEEIKRGGRDSYARARTRSSINPKCPELGGKTLEEGKKVGIREWRRWRSKIEVWWRSVLGTRGEKTTSLVNALQGRRGGRVALLVRVEQLLTNEGGSMVIEVLTDFFECQYGSNKLKAIIQFIVLDRGNTSMDEYISSLQSSNCFLIPLEIHLPVDVVAAILIMNCDLSDGQKSTALVIAGGKSNVARIL